MEVLVKVAQLILSLSILVIVHEFGHFLFAKIFKTRVEKFYLFFNPGFSLFKTKYGETEYGMGWIPLGGYVKISGMIDESMDKEQMKKPAQPHEFRSKKTWQRLLIMLGGVMMNFILAILIYSSILFAWGEQYLPTESVNEKGFMADSLAESVGFEDGDKILTINGKKVERYSNIYQEILLDRPATIRVQRNNTTRAIQIPDSIFPKLMNNPGFLQPRYPAVVGGFPKDSPAKSAGLKKGDEIVAVNGEKCEFFDQLSERLDKYKGEQVSLDIMRDSSKKEISAQVNEKGELGIAVGADLGKYYDLASVKYGFFAAIPAGINKGVSTFKSYLKQLGLIFTPKTEAYKEVGSFITIGKIFPGVWNWQAFWNLTAFLSIMLGIVNVLPIPALDGGHVMFLLYEIVSGQKPGDKFLEYAQIVGMLIVFSILILAIGNDIMRFVF
ncbi:MAG: RIP metalloprotease RseP [Bacteroidota bacterium]